MNTQWDEQTVSDAIRAHAPRLSEEQIAAMRYFPAAADKVIRDDERRRCMKVLADLLAEQEWISENTSVKHLAATNDRDQTAITQTRTFGWQVMGRKEALTAAIAALSEAPTPPVASSPVGGEQHG